MRSNPFRPLDEHRLGWFHWKSMITTGMGVFTDGYDLSSIGIVLPLVLLSFGVKSLTGLQSSMLAGSALVGAAIGAILFGLLSNRGRKTFYGVDVLLMGVAAVAQAFVTNIPELILVRFVLGIGVGADYVLSPMIMGEHANAGDRGKIMALGFGLFWGFGATVAAAVYITLMALHLPTDMVWRVVLAAGAVPALAVLYLRRRIPETARFLARIRGDVREFHAVTREITGREAPVSGPLRDDTGFSAYFARFGRQFLAACLLWFLFDIVAYSGILFGPSLIAKGLGLDPGTFQFLIEFLFTVPGGLLGMALVDRLGRKPMQVVGFLGMGAALLAFGMYKMTAGAAFIPLIGLLLYGTQQLLAQAGPGSVSASGVLGVELAPTKVRGLVQALTVASGRVGAALTAFVFPPIFQALGPAFPFYFLAAVAFAGALVHIWLVPETRRSSLEESSGELAELVEESEAV